MLAVALVDHRGRVYLPPPASQATLVLAIVVAAVIWVFGEAFGPILTGGGTDPNSGPLLALVALAYWPLATAGPRARGRRPSAAMASADPKGKPHEHPRLDPGDLRRDHAPGRRGERRAAGDGARLDPPRLAGADIAVSHLLMGIAMAGDWCPA